MRASRSYSILSLILLTALVACCVSFVARRLNPSVSELFQTLLTKIPVDGHQTLLDPADPQKLAAIDQAIAARLPEAKLPDNIKQLYTMCSGQPWNTRSDNRLFLGFALNPVDKALEDYVEFCSLYDIHVLPSESRVFPSTWYDYRLFPFACRPGTGTYYCVDVNTERIYSFHPDGGIDSQTFDSVKDLLLKSIDYQRQELGR